MSKNNINFDFAEFERFYNKNVEGLDESDHFDSGFGVAASIFYKWVAEKANIPKRFCHNCGAEMMYTENYDATYQFDGEYKHIDRIKAHVCPACDTILYSSEEAKRIENIMHYKPTLEF